MEHKKEISELKVRKRNPRHLLPPKPVSREEEEFNQFFLTLAVIFNDFRGIVLFHKYVEGHRKPEPAEISSHSGDYNGLRVQLSKILISYFHEVVRFLGENRTTLESDKFKGYVLRLPERDYETWRMLLSLAEIPGEVVLTEEGNKLVNFFTKIRNNAGYHYFQSGKNLAKGFRYHFFEKKSDDVKNQVAFFSSQRSDFYANRYYYADAAVDGYITNLANEFENIDTVIELCREYAIRAAHLFSRLLEYYLDEKPNA